MMYYFSKGTKEANLMRDLIEKIEVKKKQNPNKNIDDMTAWRYTFDYNREKPIKGIFTFNSYAIMCELDIARVNSDWQEMNIVVKNEIICVAQIAVDSMFTMKMDKLLL